MEPTCLKCGITMTEGELDHAGPFRVYKKENKKSLLGPNSNAITDIKPYICPKCGLVQFYVENPQKFQ